MQLLFNFPTLESKMWAYFRYALEILLSYDVANLGAFPVLVYLWLIFKEKV